MAEKAKYTNVDVAGFITSAVRAETKNGRAYATVILDGSEYTAWDESDIQQADLAAQAQAYVKAESSNKEGSKYWTIRKIIPVNAPEGATIPTTGLNVPIPGSHSYSLPIPLNKPYTALPDAFHPALTAAKIAEDRANWVRERALQVAADMLDKGTPVADLTAYAREVELYLLGTDLDASLEKA